MNIVKTISVAQTMNPIVSELRRLYNIYKHTEEITMKKTKCTKNCTITECLCSLPCCADICNTITEYCKSPTVNLDIVKHLHVTGVALNWEALSINMYMSIKNIFENPDLPWIPYAISMRNDLSPEIIHKYAYATKGIDGPYWFDWDYLTENPNISSKFIVSTPELPWNKICFVLRYDITQRFVAEHPSFPWNETRIDVSSLPKDYSNLIVSDWINSRRFRCWTTDIAKLHTPTK
jgi:hypothetical protein